MSRRNAFKSQASSSRASAVVGFAGFGGFGSTSTASSLSYLNEPASLSGISDPNVVVSFKNMAKKDGTTVAKGIEFLRAYVVAHPNDQDGGVEDAVLDAWIAIYPRLSIDNSRRVRELSHLVLYDFITSVRKRIEKHFPRVVGAWLAGVYDRDRSASSAAESTLLSFAKDDKLRVARLKSLYQAAILEYAQAALKETPETLSDERTMTREDMLEKFHRVVSSSLNLIFTLLNSLKEDEISSEQEKYEDILSNNRELWAFISCDDGQVRTSAAQLLTTCIEKQPAIIEANLQLIGQSFIIEGLHVSQLNSANSLLDALNSLSRKYPQVWVSKYKGKRTPSELLFNFVEKGPQGGSELYWKALWKLVIDCPKDVLFPDLSASNLFLEKLTAGITRRPLRPEHESVAWECCIDILELLLSCAPLHSSPIQLCETAVFPTFEFWLFRASPARRNNSPLTIKTMIRVYNICANIEGEEASTAFAKFFQGLADQLTEQISTSLPQQSLDYTKSQNDAADIGRRWFQFAGAVLQSAKEENLKYILEPSYGILHKALRTIEARGGKPYSAAATVEAAIWLGPQVWKKRMPSIFDELTEFVNKSFISLSQTPSAPFVFSILQRLSDEVNDDPFFNPRILWDGAIDSALKLPTSLEKVSTVAALITTKKESPIATGTQYSGTLHCVDTISHAARNNSNLQAFFLGQAHIWIQTLKVEAFKLLEKALCFDALSSDSETKLVDITMATVQLNGAPQHAANAAYSLLALLFRTKPILLRTDDIKSALVWQMLRVSEHSADLSDRGAGALTNIVDSLCSGDDVDQNRGREEAIVRAIHAGLDNVTLSSLKIDTLIEQANRLSLSTTNPETKVNLFPHVASWARDLSPLLQVQPNRSIGLMRPFAGAVFLAIQHDIEGTLQLLFPHQADLPPAPAPPNQDQYGLSRALRYAIYTLGLFSGNKRLPTAPVDAQENVLRLLALTRELVSDEVDLGEGSSLFDIGQVEGSVKIARQFITDYDLFLPQIAFLSKAWLVPAEEQMVDARLTPYDISATINKLIMNLIQTTSSENPRVHAYYASRALARLLDALCIDQEWPNPEGEEWLFNLGVIKHTAQDVLTALAIVNGVNGGLIDSQIMKNTCNHLISDLAEAKVDGIHTFGKLLLLNSCLEVYQDFIPATQNRIVFAVKNIVSWMDGLADKKKGLSSEICRALQILLPATSDIYGSQWEKTLAFCVSILKSNPDGALLDENIPMIGMSLKLYKKLRDLSEPNDDLTDALSEYQDRITQGLISLLKLERREFSQPEDYIDRYLWDMLLDLTPRPLSEVSELYPLVASKHMFIQNSAFHLVREALMKAQPDISVNVLLEKKDARFPDELLSLLLEAPDAADFTDAQLAAFPPQLRTYLFSWEMIFQSFAHASVKVRNDYTEQLKDGKYIDHLLKLIGSILGHSYGKALDLTRVNITESMRRNFDIVESLEEKDEKNMTWLLCSLYCQALIYTPMLVKVWWTNCESRQTKIQYDDWTEKFFTPLVVAAHFEEVQKWADEQEVGEDEKELLVKCSLKTREIYASYEIDDMTMQVVVRLAANYPLQPVLVSSVNRVGISEKRWNSFMITTQAVISFSGGSIPEGLSTLRRNIASALKGHTECAICYSIISSDRKTPDKKCSTCSNLFHSKCLYTWFQSSNQSTCPLCRNPFNYSTSSR